MPLTREEQLEVDRAKALLSDLSDEDKKEVVRMAYVDNRKPVEEAVREKRAKLEKINVRREQIEALADYVGLELPPKRPVGQQGDPE